MAAQKHNGITGSTGRTVSRGLERLDFFPVVLLFVVLLGGVVIWQMHINWNPRSDEEFDAQVEAMISVLSQRAESEGVVIAFPPREAWRRRSYGDVDEWSVELDAIREGEPVRWPIWVDFNLKTTGLTPRIRIWGPESGG